MLMGFPMISSISRKRIIPPSKTGMGRRFKRARFMLIIAINGTR